MSTTTTNTTSVHEPSVNYFRIDDLVIYSNTGKTYRVVKVDGDHVGMYRQGPHGDTGRYLLVSCSKLSKA